MIVLDLEALSCVEDAGACPQQPCHAAYGSECVRRRGARNCVSHAMQQVDSLASHCTSVEHAWLLHVHDSMANWRIAYCISSEPLIQVHLKLWLPSFTKFVLLWLACRSLIAAQGTCGH